MSGITGKLQTAVSELPSGYFAMVMATGIVSIASHLLGMGTIARVLFRLNLLFYAVLWLLLLSRIIFFNRRFLADLGEHTQRRRLFHHSSRDLHTGQSIPDSQSFPRARDISAVPGRGTVDFAHLRHLCPVHHQGKQTNA